MNTKHKGYPECEAIGDGFIPCSCQEIEAAQQRVRVEFAIELRDWCERFALEMEAAMKMPENARNTDLWHNRAQTLWLVRNYLQDEYIEDWTRHGE
jgi:hypothetical protein